MAKILNLNYAVETHITGYWLQDEAVISFTNKTEDWQDAHVFTIYNHNMTNLVFQQDLSGGSDTFSVTLAANSLPKDAYKYTLYNKTKKKTIIYGNLNVIG